MTVALRGPTSYHSPPPPPLPVAPHSFPLGKRALLSPTPSLLPAPPSCTSPAVVALLGDHGSVWAALSPYTTAPDADLAPSPHLDAALHQLVVVLQGAHVAAPLAVLAAASRSLAAAGCRGPFAARAADVRGVAQRAEGELERAYAAIVLQRLTRPAAGALGYKPISTL